MDFSVVIPTYAREQHLEGCLQALIGQSYPPDSFEVIVVDDGSASPPMGAIERAKSRLQIRLLRESHRGPARARNAGAAVAAGQYLAFTDDDCRPHPDWLASLSRSLENNPSCVIGGKVINSLSDNVYSDASQLLIDYLYSYYNAEPANARMLTSNNLAMPLALFRSLGGFDISFPTAAAEDRELCDRILHYGHRMIFAPDVIVYHMHTLSLLPFLRQHFNYGIGAFRYHQVRASRTSSAIRVESPSFYWKLLRYPGAVSKRRPVSLSALLTLSQIANAAGFFTTKIFEW